MKAIEKLIDKGNNNVYTFAPEFKKIILDCMPNYGKNKQALKSFLEDLQHGGCISGMIGEFIYHSDCKDFYVKHIDDLEEFKEEMEEQIGEAIKNRHNTKHYTFVVWLAFEEFCYDIYREVFEQ